jgi:hypothetical protein
MQFFPINLIDLLDRRSPESMLERDAERRCNVVRNGSGQRLCSKRGESSMSPMRKFLPHYQFFERHQTTVRCAPGELLDIIQGYQPPQDRVAGIAMYARQLPARLLHWAARSQSPPPAPFTLANFIPLARDGDREIVAGLVGKFWRPDFGLT